MPGTISGVPSAISVMHTEVCKMPYATSKTHSTIIKVLGEISGMPGAISEMYGAINEMPGATSDRHSTIREMHTEVCKIALHN